MNTPSECVKDIRKVKTQKALFSALAFLLQTFSFKTITVHDICSQAIVSRSSFYANYKDKYDLLYSMLCSTIPFSPLSSLSPLSPLTSLTAENILDVIVYGNFKMITNILRHADYETMEQVNSFAFLCLNKVLNTSTHRQHSPDYLVFSNIFINGVVGHIAKHTYQSTIPSPQAKQHFINVINHLLTWEPKK